MGGQPARDQAEHLGLALQYTVMPALGYTLAAVFELPRELAVGLILVACCPGGTASNVVAFLAEANVALSVTMTALSTATAIGLTPWLTTWLVGSRIPVDPWGLLWSTIQVIVLPIAIGHGASAELRQPLGIVVVGGLLVSQLLTLFITPVLYTYMEDLARLLRAALRRRQATPAVTEVAAAE